MDQSPPAIDPLPPRVAWFAIWRWKPWKRWAIASPVLAAALYVLSVGPALWFVGRTGQGAKLVARAYRPLRIVRGQLDYEGQSLLDGYAGLWNVKMWELMLLVDEVERLKRDFRDDEN